MKIMKLPKAVSFREENEAKISRTTSDQRDPRRRMSTISEWNVK